MEVSIESQKLTVMVDNEVVAVESPSADSKDREEIWLVAKRGDVGHWSTVELLYTPPSESFRNEIGRQNEIAIGERRPWILEAQEKGRWQIKRTTRGRSMMHGKVDVDRVDHSITSGIQLVSAVPPVPAVPAAARPATAAGALAIECWTLPGESDLARIERVVSTFVDQLQAAGITLPDNLQRVGRCGARADPQPCFIYRFGTRRVHLNIREAEGGRLCLVVRCGGGFLDFAEFARKSGRIEQAKLFKLRCEPVKGRSVLQLSSVFSRGERHVKEMRSVNATRPASSQRSRT